MSCNDEKCLSGLHVCEKSRLDSLSHGKAFSRSWVGKIIHDRLANRCFPFHWEIIAHLLPLDWNKLNEKEKLAGENMYSMKKSYTYSEKSYKSSVKRSQTTSSVNAAIASNRGFKPTDRFDPSKKSFLVDLSKKIWTKRVWLMMRGAESRQKFIEFFLSAFVGWKIGWEEAGRLAEDFHTSHRFGRDFAGSES